MDNVRDIINGSQLPRFVNKPVSIIGQVQDIDANGKFFQIRAVDDAIVRINVKEPVNTPITGWVEARGISTGRAVNAEDYVIFGNEKFDEKGHNMLCNLLYSVPNIWETS